MIRRLGRIWRHRKTLLYCPEALWHLSVCKGLILFKSFTHLAEGLGVAQCETLKEALPTPLLIELQAIGRVMRYMPHFVPWPSKCLDTAMAAQRMLARRQLPSTLYLGVRRNSAHALLAHAWLRTGQHWVVGYQPAHSFHVVACYARYSA